MLKITLNQLIQHFTILQKEALLLYYQTLESAQFDCHSGKNNDQFTKIQALSLENTGQCTVSQTLGATVRKHYQANI